MAKIYVGAPQRFVLCTPPGELSTARQAPLLVEHNVVEALSSCLAGNLPSAISERDLEDEFIRFGTLRSVWIARKPPGFGEQSHPFGHRTTLA